MPTKLQAMRDWRRVLAPGGRLVLIDLTSPRSWAMRVLLWPLRFQIVEEQADNIRGRVPGMLADAGFAFEETGVYGSAVAAYIAHARPSGAAF